jgi:multiple sugar transport system permease protein
MRTEAEIQTVSLTPRPQRRYSLRLRPGYLFMVPAFGLLLLFMLSPTLYAVYTAFTNMALTGVGAANPQWIGTANFNQLFHDPNFFNALRVSITYLAGSAIIGQCGLGLLLALLMQHRNMLFKSTVGGIVVAAWVVPDVVAGFLWSAFLHQDGLLNTILALFGLPQRAWLQDHPMASIIVANTWRGTAFSMLLFAGALTTISPDLLEAAAIDGAGLTSRLRHIILPLLRGAIATDLLLITLQTLSDFTLVFVLTGGGPGFQTQLMTIYMYQEAFKFYQLGYGTAVSLLIIAVGAILSLIYVRILRVEI